MARLRELARAVLPAEACGALGGSSTDTGWSVARFVPLPNNTQDPGRFAVDATALARAEAALRADGLSLVGFAHSHPDGSPTLSLTDRCQLWPGLHLVLAISRSRGTQLMAHWLDRSGSAAPLRLELTA